MRLLVSIKDQNSRATTSFDRWPGYHILATMVVPSYGAVIPSGPHTTLLESGARTRMDMDRFGLASLEEAPCYRERSDRLASPVLLKGSRGDAYSLPQKHSYSS